MRMSGSVYRAVAAIVLVAVVSGCIKNDIPYPRRLGKITAFEVSGQIGDAVIDSTALTVTVDMADTALLSSLRLLRFETTESTTVEPSMEDVSYVDLSSPLELSLQTWPDQTYLWTITATQAIERYITVRNQVQEPSINPDELQAVVYVSPETPKDSIEITGIKLGPANSTISPDPLTVHDFTSPQTFTVSWRDTSEVWTIAAVQMEAVLTTQDADAWAYSAYLYGMVPEGSASPGFRWRRADSDQWQEVDQSSVTVSGTSVSARITGLDAGTEYVYKIYSDVQEGSEVSFTTEEDAQMPNMSFDEWSKVGKNWYANADQNNPWWDSGNEGANMIGEANPTSPEETKVISGKAARLETVSVLGVMAGGNIYSGDFGKTVMSGGMGAEVYFGRPFSSRPITLSGYYSYEPKTIDNARAPYDNLMGEMDRCHIFVYVMASDAPKTVNTVEGRYLDINDPDVLGYGELIDEVGTGGEYKQFTINIKYRESNRNVKPTYCAVVAVASQYADYFTGGIGSLMYVDEFSFGYDGDVIWE